MAAPPTAFFDLDGTLLLFRGAGRLAMTDAIHEVWGIPNAVAKVNFVGATDQLVFDAVRPGADFTAVAARYTEIFRERLETWTGDPVLPGAAELLPAIAARGWRIAVVTGNLRSTGVMKLERSNLDSHVDLSISAFGDDARDREGIYRTAWKRAGFPARAIGFGDAPGDVTSAKAIGAKSVAIWGATRHRDELAAESPDLLLENLRDAAPVFALME
jgi:phosphoglycolate phosphatase-like HAD superfamily hydrolase